MTCKHGESAQTVNYGEKGNVQYHRCEECRRKFSGPDVPQG
jgi:hypothetical protein